jgi:hypothetical protein
VIVLALTPRSGLAPDSAKDVWHRVAKDLNKVTSINDDDHQVFPLGGPAAEVHGDGKWAGRLDAPPLPEASSSLAL